jgi:hypothetical protein
MMYYVSDRGLASIARATALALALCCFASAPVLAADGAAPSARAMTPEFFVAAADKSSGLAKDFTEEDINKRVEEVVAERSKDGAFVFHDPKIDADLNLIFEQVKIVRGMEGYGWFANTIFHDKEIDKKKYAIDCSP